MKRNIAWSLSILFLVLVGIQVTIGQAQPPQPPVRQEGPAGGEQDLSPLRDPQREAQTAAALPLVVTPDPLIQQMINQVESTDVYSMAGELTGEWATIIGGSPYTITNRNTYGGDPIQHAAQYVYEHFQADGLAASYHVWSGAGYPNVVGEVAGLGRPDDIWLITSHLDDMPTNPIAPGADDNGSGSTGVLMAAQILSQYSWDCTLRFITFTGEEQGLLGSDAYAQMAANNGDNILGVLNLDMIAYNSDAYPIIELHTRPGNTGDLAIANLFVGVINAYNLNLTPQIVQDGISASDHYSFWLRGYSAILAIEDFEDFTPYYHTVNDRLSTLDLDYYTEFIRAAVGAFAHAGCLLGEVGALDGTVTDLAAGWPLTATVTAQNSLAAFETTSDASGYYTLTLPVDAYTVTAQAHLYGYYPAAVTDVVVLTDTVTHQNLALDPYPTYVISGVVSDTATGEPLSATLQTVACPGGDCQARTYAATTSNLASGYYSLTLISGTYTLRVSADGYRPLTRTVSVDRDQTQDFGLLPQGCVLLVDDDGGGDAEAAYTAALDALGVDYAAWTVDVQGVPSTSLMEQYRQVLWLTGERYVNTLTAADRSALSAYLDGGGRLFLSGWGVGGDLDGAPGGAVFLSDYLHADYSGDGPWGSTEPLTGGGFLAGLPVSITIPLAQPASKLASVGGGETVYALPPPDGGTAVAYAGAYRVVYFGFGYEWITTAADREAVLAAVLDWLGPCVSPPEAGFESSSPDLVGTATVFTNTTIGAAPISYTWSFGDGVTGAVDSPTHTYPAVGLYTAWLTATNAGGVGSVSHTVEITGAPPRAGFASSEPVELGRAVAFTNTTVAGMPVETTYEWDFGDGVGASSVVNPVYTYTAVGSYTVWLTATNLAGSDGYSGTVVVEPAGRYTVYLPLVVKGK